MKKAIIFFILDLIHKERALYIPREIKKTLAKRREKTTQYARKQHKVEYKIIFLLVISLARRLYASVPFDPSAAPRDPKPTPRHINARDIKRQNKLLFCPFSKRCRVKVCVTLT